MTRSNKIQQIFQDNEAEDLQSFINERKMLNRCNVVCIYLFHIVQSAGILTTTIATSYNVKSIVWLGVGLNFVATLISIFEKTNASLSSQLYNDIKSIKEGTFTEESLLVDPALNNDRNATENNTQTGNYKSTMQTS